MNIHISQTENLFHIASASCQTYFSPPTITRVFYNLLSVNSKVYIHVSRKTRPIKENIENSLSPSTVLSIERHWNLCLLVWYSWTLLTQRLSFYYSFYTPPSFFKAVPTHPPSKLPIIPFSQPPAISVQISSNSLLIRVLSQTVYRFRMACILLNIGILWV